MTSVLYSAGLNYQTGNPVRAELGNLRAAMADLRKVVEGVTTEFTNVKNEVRNLSRIATANRASVSVLTQQVNALQAALTSVAQQGNFTAPSFTPVQNAPSASAPAPAPAPSANTVEDDFDSEEDAPAPAPKPRARRRAE